MCVISYVPMGVALRKSDAEAMWADNPHGAGFAVLMGGEWKFEKGFMSLEALLKRLEELKLLNSEVHPPFVVHFRVASVGEVSPELTHPFPIQLREGIGVLFHNGTLDVRRSAYSSYYSSGMIVSEGESDTSQFAKYLSELELSKKQLKLLVKEGGILDPLRNGSRLCICLPQEEEPLLIGQWHDYKGMKVSNMAFVSKVSHVHWDWWRWDYPSLFREEEGQIVEAHGLYFKVQKNKARLLKEDELEKLSLEEVEEGELILSHDGAYLFVGDDLYDVLGVSYTPDIVYVLQEEKPTVAYKRVDVAHPHKPALGKIEGDTIYYLGRGGRWIVWARV